MKHRRRSASIIITLGIIFLILGITGSAETIGQTLSGNALAENSVLINGPFPVFSMLQSETEEISVRSSDSSPVTWTWTLDGVIARSHYGVSDSYVITGFSVGEHHLSVSTTPASGHGEWTFTVDPDGSLLIDFNTIAIIVALIIVFVGAVIFVKFSKR